MNSVESEIEDVKVDAGLRKKKACLPYVLVQSSFILVFTRQEENPLSSDTLRWAQI